MGGLRIVLALLLGLVSCSHGQMFGSVVEVTVKPGDNITLYCDCKLATGIYIVWFRNCSHENQPTRIMKTKFDSSTYDPTQSNYQTSIFNFQFLRNFSSNSYDLQIMNVSASDEGFYYCGTEKTKVEEKEYITSKLIYSYGNITRLICNSSLRVPHDNCQGCGSCWTLLFALCPVSAVLSSLLTSLVVYYYHNKVKNPQVNQLQPCTGGQKRHNQVEDLCYAALEIREPSQRPRTKNRKSSDFSTYASINTSSQ